METKFCLGILHIFFISWLNAEPIVTISQGTLQGKLLKSRNGRDYSAFLGIPYAKPPVGNLRFSNPIPADNWNEVRLATSFGNICLQCDENEDQIIGSEDCLFLNVYSPALKFNSSLPLLPVMFWIHGGAFYKGSSNLYTAEYLLDKDVILVTINYRLGMLGFLRIEDSAVSGNFGLKDQVLALKWVQQNIKSFQGDPNRVTIFGESAGGASVALQALSKASTGLFQQYIIQSGSSLCPWAYKDRSKYSSIYMEYLSEVKFCYNASSSNILKCLRQKSAKDLISCSQWSLAKIFWRPTDEPDEEGAFLTDSPLNLINNNQMKDLPFMSGIVVDEGLLLTSKMYKLRLPNFIVKLFKFLLNWSVKKLMNIISILFPNELEKNIFTEPVIKFYFAAFEAFSSIKTFAKSLTNFITDRMFHYPQLKMLSDVTTKMKKSNYFYSFGYRGTFSATSRDIKINENIGVTHADELKFLFPESPDTFKYPNLKYTQTDNFVIDLMVDLWTSFAISGKPTSTKLSDPDLWKPFDTENNFHLQIGNINNNNDPSVTLSTFFNSDRMNFWRMQFLNSSRTRSLFPDISEVDEE